MRRKVGGGRHRCLGPCARLPLARSHQTLTREIESEVVVMCLQPMPMVNNTSIMPKSDHSQGWIRACLCHHHHHLFLLPLYSSGCTTSCKLQIPPLQHLYQLISLYTTNFGHERVRYHEFSKTCFVDHGKHFAICEEKASHIIDIGQQLNIHSWRGVLDRP